MINSSGSTVHWSIVEYGKRYVTTGVPGGDWALVRDGQVYTLHRQDSGYGVEISARHGVYYALDIATAYVATVTAVQS